MPSVSSTSSCPSNAESDTSSVVFDHESFATFRSRVLVLAASLWPDAGPDEVQIEALKGGGFNRIIGMTLAPCGTDGNTRYILRIPRFDAAQVANDVAVLRFLQQQTTIPAPQVVTSDETDGNALGSPYAVHHLIPGADLCSTYPGLTYEQRYRVAQELGGVFNQMLAVRSSTAGKLVLPADRESPDVPLYVEPFSATDPKPARPYSASAPSESARYLLTSLFLARKADDQACDQSETVASTFWDRFCQMTSDLDTGGWLADPHYSIAHLDFAPRNIMVNPAPDAQAPIITGILDWDSAVLGPRFLSCAPPLWIWAWQDDEDEDQRTANDVPPTAEGRRLKALFEEAAGEEYVRFAYAPAYRLARRLVGFATGGFRSNEDFRDAEAMLQEWEALSADPGGYSRRPSIQCKSSHGKEVPSVVDMFNLQALETKLER